MSARLDGAATEAQTVMLREREALERAKVRYADSRLRYVRAALDAGWPWRRIGYDHKGFWEQNRQRAGRLP